MNILLVGAGSVGKVYGRHLAMGGAKVSFLVKEKYAEAARAGFTFYVLNERTKRDQAQAWRHFSVLTQISEVKNKKWDYILLCMASTGLKGPWLDKLIAVSGDATYVSLQPGLNDQDYLLTKLPANRLIAGTIPIISYETPLPGEQRAVPGTAYWIPPGGTAAFSGPPLVLEPLLAVFRAGKFAVKTVSDTRAENVVAAPALTLFIAALDACHWSFKELNASPLFKQATLAMNEAIAANAKKAGVKKPATWFLTPAFFKMILKASPMIVPFDLETYLKVHFTKVSEQMHQSLKDYLAFAEKHGLPVKELHQFISALKL